ncbi:hypothetical protein SCUCBS95973_003917 [Sporothrix curviconia]|uniref:BTB domain-containing protein n=1 Tax=Sporothrix curviconia TaxID=1260050 RepID=A0ABP0BJA8_9PEZI
MKPTPASTSKTMKTQKQCRAQFHRDCQSFQNFSISFQCKSRRLVALPKVKVSTPTQQRRMDTAMPSFQMPSSPRYGADLVRPEYDFESWDVKVVCGPFRWYLHKNVLRKCRYFSGLLPARSGDSEVKSTIHLNNHIASQIAQVIRFMYYHEYPGADYDHENPLYGDSLLTNTAMYMAGASVDHRGMMRFATQHIETWAKAVFPDAPISGMADGGQTGQGARSVYVDSPLYKAVCTSNGLMDYAVLRLVYPLHRSLTIVYDQPNNIQFGPLQGLRVALIRFVATALPMLAISPAFQAHFRNEWLRPLQSPFHPKNLADRSLADWISAGLKQTLPQG